MITNEKIKIVQLGKEVLEFTEEYRDFCIEKEGVEGLSGKEAYIIYDLHLLDKINKLFERVAKNLGCCTLLSGLVM